MPEIPAHFYEGEASPQDMQKIFDGMANHPDGWTSFHCKEVTTTSAHEACIRTAIITYSVPNVRAVCQCECHVPATSPEW